MHPIRRFPSPATGTSVSYLPPYFHHHVAFVGLALGTVYFYQCGDAAGGFSPTLTFTSAVGYESSSHVKVAVFGDMVRECACVHVCDCTCRGRLLCAGLVLCVLFMCVVCWRAPCVWGACACLGSVAPTAIRVDGRAL